MVRISATPLPLSSVFAPSSNRGSSFEEAADSVSGRGVVRDRHRSRRFATMACGVLASPAAYRFTVLLLVLFSRGSVNSLSVSELFPYGVNQDQSLPKENDISSAEVQLSSPITFYGTEYSTLYVSRILRPTYWAFIADSSVFLLCLRVS